jgi:hypothetical protein
MGIVKDLVDIAKVATIAATKGIKTLKGKRAAERALRHLLAGGSETDATFLKDVKIINAAEIGGRPAELVSMVAKRAAKKPAAKKVAAKKPAAKKVAAKKPAAKKVAA